MLKLYIINKMWRKTLQWGPYKEQHTLAKTHSSFLVCKLNPRDQEGVKEQHRVREQ